jgi:predicted nucleic acid-binding protein
MWCQKDDNLFIDTNTYLNFYHFSSDDLEELKKLSVAVENNSIKLYVTRQVINEFRRNREAKIADACNKFKAQKLPDQFPEICKAYEEYGELRKILKEFKEAREHLMESLNTDIESKQLVADRTIKKLFDVAQVLEVDDDVVQKAKNRVILGNPPGKSKSYGDSINWECLLEKVPSGRDLHLVTDDLDYVSKISEEKLAEFLEWEWVERKGSKIFYYHRLSEFLRSQFPDIKLASELEKELAIDRLITSANFELTHLAISRLSKFTDFSDSEIREMAEACITNNQIYSIKDDPDVRTFLDNLIREREQILEPEMLEEFARICGSEEEQYAFEDDDDKPF